MGFRYLLLALAVWGLYLIIRHLARQRKLQQPRRAISDEAYYHSVLEMFMFAIGIHAEVNRSDRDNFLM